VLGRRGGDGLALEGAGLQRAAGVRSRLTAQQRARQAARAASGHAMLSRPACAMAMATRSTSASCGVRTALLWAEHFGQPQWMPASVTRSVSQPSGESWRSSRPAASNSTSSMSWQGQPAER
jgi:hypothetical protein